VNYAIEAIFDELNTNPIPYVSIAIGFIPVCIFLCCRGGSSKAKPKTKKAEEKKDKANKNDGKDEKDNASSSTKAEDKSGKRQKSRKDD